MRKHSEDFLKRYDWDWFIARKTPGPAPELASKTVPVVATQLLLEDQPVPLGPEYSLRWVSEPGGTAQPILYFQGKRVTGVWDLNLAFRSRADPHGGNANTA